MSNLFDDILHPQKPVKEIIADGAQVVDKQAPDTFRDILLILTKFRTRLEFKDGGLEVTFHSLE